jgi:pimeloyl-ACP methyl ester carboxylesterase
MWDPQIPALQDAFRILRYDTRGHGLSAAPPGPYTYDQLGHDVLALLDAAQISRATFCGLSMGGQTGIWLGANAP